MLGEGLDGRAGRDVVGQRLGEGLRQAGQAKGV